MLNESKEAMIAMQLNHIRQKECTAKSLSFISHMEQIQEQGQ